jgi:hypothetical protein
VVRLAKNLTSEAHYVAPLAVFVVAVVADASLEASVMKEEGMKRSGRGQFEPVGSTERHHFDSKEMRHLLHHYAVPQDLQAYRN